MFRCSWLSGHPEEKCQLRGSALLGGSQRGWSGVSGAIHKPGPSLHCLDWALVLGLRCSGLRLRQKFLNGLWHFGHVGGSP